MREELARIRGGALPETDQSGTYRRGENYPATGRVEGYGRREPPASSAGLERYGRPEPRVVTDEDGDEILYDRIEALQKIPAGWLITLESGQVWRQMNSKRYRLREGQEVKIKPARWGNSYRLSVSQLGSFIQVERVK